MQATCLLVLVVTGLLPLVRCDKHSKKVTEWDVTVYTGNAKRSGTNAGVYVMLYSSNAQTTFRQLNTGQVRFMVGSVAKISMSLEDVGTPQMLTIWHDNRGPRPAWFLKKVTLADKKKTYVFECNCWIGLGTADHRIHRNLFPRNGVANKGTVIIDGV